MSDTEVVRCASSSPVEAGLVRHPLEWHWASTRALDGLEPPAIPLAERALRAVLDDSPKWRERYVELIAT